MLRAVPTSFFTWDFSILGDDVEVAVLTTGWMGERGSLRVERAEYELYRQGWLSGAFVLEGEGIVVARADKLSPFTRTFDVAHDDRRLSLVAQSPLTRAFDVYDARRAIGSIYPDHCLTSQATIDLPDDMTLPVKGFLFWLVVLMWRRAARRRSS
jgi:hypothetical protein